MSQKDIADLFMPLNFYSYDIAHCNTLHFPSLAPIFFAIQTAFRIRDKFLWADSFSTYSSPTVFYVFFQDGRILSFDLFTPLFAP